MKKKVFFVVSNLNIGGAQRVYWLLCQYLDKSLYEVTLIVFDSRNAFFSLELTNVSVVQLNTIKSSKSFFPLYKLLKERRPDVVFTTAAHVMIVVALVSVFVKIPCLFARESNIPHERVKYLGIKARAINLFKGASYKQFTKGICQSQEIRESLSDNYHIPLNKLVLIPNPVEISANINKVNRKKTDKSIVVVGRLSAEKGLERLLNIINELPNNYRLSIIGDGALMCEIINSVNALNLTNRVKLLGKLKNIPDLLAEYDLLVVSSHTEGFPNVVLESLSVGTPVVTFRVGGVTEIIKNGFNGYIAEQDDVDSFSRYVTEACNREWNSEAIKRDIESRYGIKKIVSMYENLMCVS